MSLSPLRCPSCDHGNPAGAKFCNNCGLPVHLHPCGNCEAINDRTANRCHQCGSPLALTLVPQAKPVAAVADSAALSSADQFVDTRTSDLPEQLHTYDATVDPVAALPSTGVEHTAKTVETQATPLRQPAHQDPAMPAARSDWESIQVVVAKRRRPGLRAAIAAVMLVALAVPAYLAYQYPAQFREQLDAITSRFEGALVTQLPTSQPLPTSPQLPVLADNPASPQRETVPLPQDAAISSSATVVATGEAQSQPPDLARDAQLPSVDAGRAMQSPPDGTTREPSGQLPDVAALSRSASGEPQSPSPAVVGESAIPVPEARTAPRSQAARNARSNAVRSTAARSKQGGVARTVAAPKASDARTRARSSEARRSEARERAGR